MGDAHMGLQARLMSQALRKLTGVAYRTETTIVFINQLRQKIGVVFGNPETTTGGNALKFYASVRLDVRRIGQVKVGEDAIGNRTRVKVVKNKCARPFQEAEFEIRWGTGIDHAADLLDREADGKQVATETAVLLRVRQAQDVVAGEELLDVPRELGRPIDLGSARRDPIVGEHPDRVAQRELVVGQAIGRGRGRRRGRGRGRAGL